jgi:cobyrinic acid a,c-diamide synthase
MSCLARIALGTVQEQAQSQPLTWALLDLLNRQGLQIQHFFSRACFAKGGTTAAGITGLNSRHLDSWVMPQGLCREIFVRGTATADFGFVEGRYLPVEQAAACGGRLGQLCDWLDLARIVVIDVRHIEHCKLAPRPRQVEAIVLDVPADCNETARLVTHFETIWGVPVLGCLEMPEALRHDIESADGAGPPAQQLCQEVGNRLIDNFNLKRLVRLASDRQPLDRSLQLFSAAVLSQPVCVAVAYDAAFHAYFADTLDLLELRGATVVDFSPLRDESLPPEVDIVYFGCGHPEQFARELADNHCMLAALRNHVCAGKRLYAEGGGLAYLCREIETPDGQRLPMVGAFPATARLNAFPSPALAYEAELASGNWLGRPGARLRGYLNPSWMLEATAELSPCLNDPLHGGDLVSRHHALGSRLHLNFAAYPDALAGFLRSHAASLQWQCRTK